MAMRILKAGLRIGKYEVVAHIATGGMGAVYKATDTLLGRTVALKVLPRDKAQSSRDLERFKREAQHAAKLMHPNIVTLYDFDCDEALDLYYLAMEFIDGRDLAYVIKKKGQLTPTETRGILVQACEALDHASSQGIIHRDIKPSNFLLAKMRDKHVVKLADMGLAIVENDDDYKVTREGRTVGTIDYMAPEQARDSRAADIRSDIYSLGCTAYHMLTGQAPFAQGGLGERLYKHLHEAPTDVRELNPQVSAGLWRVIAKMLAKAPEDRYATPVDLLTDLRRVTPEATAEESAEILKKPKRPAPAPPPAREMNTSVPEQTADSEADREPPKPKRKRARSQAKMELPIGKLIGAGVGLAVIILFAVIIHQTLKSFRGKGDDSTQQVKDDPPPDPTPKPVRTVIEQPIDPALAKLPPVMALDPFKGHEWPGRQFVPFAGVGPRPLMDQIKAVHAEGTIRLASNGSVIPVSMTWESLKRLKYQEGIGYSWSVLLVANHGWFAGAQPKAISGEMLTYCQNSNYAAILADLFPLTEREFDIDQAGLATVRNRPCVSINVRRSDKPPVRLSFDQQTNLLVKAEYQMRMLGPNGAVQPNPTSVELYFGNYRQSGGVNHWLSMEQWRDGKRFSDWTFTKIVLHTRADDALFAFPGLEVSAKQAMIDFRKDQIKRALPLVGSTAGTELATLVRGLSLKDPGPRWTVRDGVLAFAGLWRQNQAALQTSDLAPLSTLLFTTDDELPSFALEAMTKLGPQAADAAPHLVTLGNTSGDPKVLVGAIGALKSVAVKNDATLGLLVKLLDHPDAAVKDTAAAALFELGPERLSIDRLAALMARPQPQVRTEAARLLRQRLAQATPADLPMLREGLRNPVREVKLAFVDALGSLKSGGQDAVPDLLPLLVGPDKELADRTVRALEQMGQLVSLARDNTDPAVMAASIAALHARSLKSPEALTIYQSRLDHPNDAVKNAAALAMIELAPDKLDKAKLADLMARPKPIDLAATFALHKADPENKALKTRGVDILIKSLKPDLRDMKAFIAEPLRSRAAEVLVDVGGGGAIVPVVKHLLSDNNPTKLVENQKVEPTAARVMGYELLLRFAQKAKSRPDRDLIEALKKQESQLNVFWYQQESTLSNRFKKLPDVPVETKQLHVAAVDAANRAGRAIAILRAP